MEECVFCKIINNELPASKEYEDEEILAFNDINPKAPIHIIIIPKEHSIKSVADIKEEDIPLMGKLIYIAKKIAQEKGLIESGYRLVFNVGEDGGAVIKNHIHLHLIGGRKLGSEA